MAEFEARSKVTVYASGVSSEFKPITDEDKLAKIKKQRQDYNSLTSKKMMKDNKGVFDFDRMVCQNPEKSKSGYQNLQHVRDDIYTVLVCHRHLGTFPLKEALDKRDKYRHSVGMPPAVDRVIS